MPRTYVVTGSAAGLGQATCELLAKQGARVIGVDLHDAEVIADLSTPAGRQHMIEAVTDLSGGRLEGVVASAGIGAWFPPETIMSTNFFGAMASLDGLRHLLARGDRARAVVLASFAVLRPDDKALVDACLDMDEARAIAIAKQSNGAIAYNSSKRAVARWVRRHAISDAWAGAGIALNSVSPGITDTPQNARMLSTPEGTAKMKAAVPMPYHGVMQAEEVAAAIVWLVTPASTAVTGQCLFIDGGAECVVRGDDVWRDIPSAASSG